MNNNYTLTVVPARLDYTWSVDDLVLWTNIEANCVLFGACIPCLFPLVEKIFGASALSGRAPRHQNQDQGGTAITIGSSPKKRRQPRDPLGLSQLATQDNKNKNNVIEQRTLHISTTELRAEDTDQTVNNTEHGQQDREGHHEGGGGLRQPQPSRFRQRWQEGRRIERE
ncbi:hypothetical protein F5144DRAFT_575494 [Chaetomium tenue]|uniref:Uncharacterized protein n=1 Tax=Chaetomium tenue TaxID=1854479 RepID=A0ACB7P346_9PEZI|nr:hypothetical protein F5144DRAFT_575494 [Chaetomium globosum]